MATMNDTHLTIGMWLARTVNGMRAWGQLRSFLGTTAIVIIDENGLKFNYKMCKTSNWVEIKLNGKDLFDVTFSKVRGTSYKVVSTHNDIYGEDLSELFYNQTFLVTHF